MTILWITVGVVLGLWAGWKLYLGTLASMYVESLRTHEVHTLTTTDLWKLRLARYRKGRTEGEPVLLVHGVCVNHHNFTVPEGVSLVDYLMEKGYDCWAIDLRGTSSSEAPFEHHRNEIRADDFIRYDLPEAIAFIRNATGYSQVHWVGHSLGGMLLYAYVVEHGDTDIASGITLGAPPGFPPQKKKIPKSWLYLVRHCPVLCGNLIRALVPVFFTVKFNSALFPTNVHNLHSKLNAAHVYVLLENPIPKVQTELARWDTSHTWLMCNGEVDVGEQLATLRFPLLAIFGAQDPLIPLWFAHNFFEKLPHDDKKMIVMGPGQGCAEDYSHCDLAFGKNGNKEVYTPVVQWLRSHGDIGITRVVGDEHDDQYIPPLHEGQRAGILSGRSYQHLTTSKAPESVSIQERDADSVLAGLERRARTASNKDEVVPDKSPGISKAAADVGALANTIVALESSALKNRRQVVRKVPKQGNRAPKKGTKVTAKKKIGIKPKAVKKKLVVEKVKITSKKKAAVKAKASPKDKVETKGTLSAEPRAATTETSAYKGPAIPKGVKRKSVVAKKKMDSRVKAGTGSRKKLAVARPPGVKLKNW